MGGLIKKGGTTANDCTHIWATKVQMYLNMKKEN